LTCRVVLFYVIPSYYRGWGIPSIGAMQIMPTILLAVLAFGLGACPFSIWIGRLFLGKDIREYGDGNPGAANVFRAGGHKLGYLAVFLDVAKGIPFVFLAHSHFELPNLAVMAVALSAILGHAFSPLLRWRGGKAIAVTFGVLLALPQHDMLIAFAALMVLGFLFIEIDAWTVMFGATGSLAYLAITRGSSWESLFMLCVLAIFAVKHFEELHNLPGARGRLVRWFQTIMR
jgi:glycerol-3-phosphate acyltransferase PlsY